MGTASFFSDVAHEIATSVLPLLTAGFGSPAFALGLIEGIADAASGAAKLWSGWWSDRLGRRKPLAVAGYILTAIFTALLGVSSRLWQAVAARSIAWVGRGARTPVRNALLAEGVPAAHYGKAFGLERAMDTTGAVVAPFVAAALVLVMPPGSIVLWTVVPGLLAAAAIGLLVSERPRPTAPRRSMLGSFALLPAPFRSFLVAIGLFGLGDFAHTLLLLRAIELLTPGLGARGAAAAAMTLYGLHNIAGASLALVFGALGDRFGRLRTLAVCYLLGPAMLALLILPPPHTGGGAGLPLISIFILGGALLAAQDSLEAAAAAELLPADLRGFGFGVLAAINSAGDLISSLAVGLVWKIGGAKLAFGAPLLPMMAGVVVLGMAAFRRPARRI